MNILFIVACNWHLLCFVFHVILWEIAEIHLRKQNNPILKLSMSFFISSLQNQAKVMHALSGKIIKKLPQKLSWCHVMSAVPRFGAWMIRHSCELGVNIKDLAFPHQQKLDVDCTKRYDMALDRLVFLH